MTLEPRQPSQPASIDATPTGGWPTPGPVTPTKSPAAPKRKGASTLVNVVLGVALVIAIGGVAFAVGRSTAPATASGPNGFPNGGLGNGQFPTGSGAPGLGGPGGFQGGGRTVTGTVDSVSDDTITITTENGQTLELSLGADTTYSTKSPGAASDVTAGETVEVQLDFGAAGGGATASGTPGTAESVTIVP